MGAARCKGAFARLTMASEWVTFLIVRRSPLNQNVPSKILALGEIEWVKPLPVELKAGQIP
jgi:hypothetical protein